MTDLPVPTLITSTVTDAAIELKYLSKELDQVIPNEILQKEQNAFKKAQEKLRARNYSRNLRKR